MTKMEYAEAIAQNLGGEAKEVVKNNGMKLIGISLKNAGISPCVYIDQMYEQGMTVGEATAEVKEIMDTNPAPTDFSPEMLADFDKAKQFLSLRLYNADNEYEVSKSVAEYGFDDLIIIPVLTGFMPNINASVKVGKDLIKRWGVTEEEVFATAKANMNADDYEIIDMNEMLKMLGAPIPEGDIEMYVLSNKDRIFGAIGAILLQDKLKEMFPNGYIVIPSSVHEVIILPYIGESGELQRMINEVNSCEVAPDEVLGNKPYIFA